MAENNEALQELSLPANYEQRMTPEERRKVNELILSIDIHDKGKITALGQEEQAKIGKYYDSLLEGTSTSQIGEAGNMLAEVIGKVNEFKVDCGKEESGLFSFFKKKADKLRSMQTRYQSVSKNMDSFVADLQKKCMELDTVSRSFDVMYDVNLQTYNFLSMIIYAGERKLEEEKEQLTIMQQRATQSGDLIEIQKVSDYNDDILRFERKIYDLKLSRAISMQQAPQIRSIQKNADEIAESIRASIATTIPLWKSQMAMALGMQAVTSGINAVNSVRDTTNQLLIANSNMNKQMTIEAAKAAEKGFVDIETIKTVNQNLLDSLNGSFEIAKKAAEERTESTKQLQIAEAELKDAIMKYTN